jgi:hypothetical protein
MVGATRGTPEGFRADQAVVLSNHHRHLQIWLKSWPDKQNFLTSLCRLRWATSVSNHEAEMNPCRPVIKTSLVRSLRYSIRRMNLLTLTPGSALSNPSSPYCQPHVQMRIRRSLQLSNSEALPAYGGISFKPCSLPVMWLLGMSSGPLSERITSRRDSLSESSMNFKFDPRYPYRYTVCTSLQPLVPICRISCGQ